MIDASALVLFSGGRVSATCQGYALCVVEAIGFDYGRKHRLALDLRARAERYVPSIELKASRWLQTQTVI